MWRNRTMWPTVKRQKNILVDSDDPYDKIFRKGFIYNNYKYVKEFRGKEGLNGVGYGEFQQINENHTKEPNRNSVTEIYHIFKNYWIGWRADWTKQNKRLVNWKRVDRNYLAEAQRKNILKMITVSKTCGTISTQLT